MHQWPLCLWVFVLALRGWRILFLLLKRLKAFVFVLGGRRFWPLFLERLKVFGLTFECWRFWLFVLNVEESCSHFWMLKVLTFTFGCSKFLFLVLDVENSCSYSWILKVFIFVLRCWRFLLLLLDVEGFCFWMLKVYDYWSFIFLHILKKNDVKIYSILFRSWLYKYSLTYNNERFMKGDFLMINHVTYVLFYVWTFVMTFVVFML